jgi:hypothetical protein
MRERENFLATKRHEKARKGEKRRAHGLANMLEHMRKAVSCCPVGEGRHEKEYLCSIDVDG